MKSDWFGVSHANVPQDFHQAQKLELQLPAWNKANGKKAGVIYPFFHFLKEI